MRAARIALTWHTLLPAHTLLAPANPAQDVCKCDDGWSITTARAKEVALEAADADPQVEVVEVRRPIAAGRIRHCASTP